jgi:tRNA1Val (adenine37-N6)-methyltransferase
MEETELMEGERIDDLQAGGCRIIQHPGLFRFGTDAILLQNFVRLAPRARAVDLGTGTGILPILLCARHPQVVFDAVEIQSACAGMARRSMRLNGLEARVRVHEMDLKDAPDELGRERYDAVVCNPPYGKRGGALRNPNDALAIARHEVRTDLETVVRSGAALLRNGGRFFLIHQADRLAEIACRMWAAGVPLKRIRLVHPRAGRRAQFALLEGVKQAGEGCIVLPPLILGGEDGEPTEELQRIYRGERTV